MLSRWVQLQPSISRIPKMADDPIKLGTEPVTEPVDTEGQTHYDPDPAEEKPVPQPTETDALVSPPTPTAESLPASPPSAFEGRYPIGAGDMFDRLHALEVHLKALLASHSHEDLHAMGIKNAPPEKPHEAHDIGGDTVDSSPMDD